ncbi:hypothetical protein FPOA_09771 [Fusarium poae]|uniref:F-box domain-containing protein n=1 Tax=Fusarium poae TaxID=36050 RepID=A0A1B8AC41_FUSPO|nr:hypothetical protein FPOA_09771 [Fusarium poae]
MAPATALENIPTETVQQIASFLNHKDTEVSHSHAVHFDQICITFDPKSTHGRATLALVKKATIIKNMVWPCYHIDQWDTMKHPLYPAHSTLIPRAIMQTLQAMTSLESLHLSVLELSVQQKRMFLGLLEKEDAPGIKLQHLTIRATINVAKPFILKCSHELRSLDTNVSSSMFKSKKLERLRIHLYYNQISSPLYQYPSLTNEEEYGMPSLRNISNDFPSLKTLILHETREYNMFSNNADPNIMAAIIANTLKKRYRRLERLAFTSIWMQAYDIKFNETFFHNLVGRIAREHRVLREVCVLVEPPQFYEWKRDQGTTIRSFHEMPNRNGFPFGVEE